MDQRILELEQREAFEQARMMNEIEMAKLSLLEKISEGAAEGTQHQAHHTNLLHALKFNTFENGKDNTENYLDKFEYLCCFSNTDKKTYVIGLLQHLKGEDLNCVYAMDKNDKDNYQKIKARLI